MRTIKLRHNTPFPVEMRLINKYGYHVQKKQYNEFFLFAKGKAPETQLSLAQETELTKRCDNIAMSFADPYANVGPLRARIVGMTARMSPAETKFCMDYLDENFPTELKPVKTVLPPLDNPPVLVTPSTKAFDKYQELADRCDRTINFFADPDNAIPAIRTRIHNFMQGLTTQERDYVAGYMAVKFPQAGIA